MIMSYIWTNQITAWTIATLNQVLITILRQTQQCYANGQILGGVASILLGDNMQMIVG